MPEIRPFKGVRYNSEKIGDISRVVAPPYDVIDPEQHANLIARDPLNCVQLILGSEPGKKGDYEEGSRMMAAWEKEGVLIRDKSPCYYLIEDSFELPGEKSPRRRWGIIGRIRLEPLDSGRIHPHERTHLGPKEDRLKLMHSFGGNLSQIFALFDGDAGVVRETLAGTFESNPAADFQDADGIGRKMWVIRDQAVVDRISKLLSDRDYYIADGHHRYETALNYAQEMSSGGPDADSNFVMMALVGMEDPGLAILPTHRLLHGFVKFDFGQMLQCLEDFFEVSPLTPEQEAPLRAGLPPSGEGRRSFTLYDPASDNFFRALLKPGADLANEIPDLPASVRELEVTLAEALLMVRCLNMTSDQISHQEHLEYFKDSIDAMERARSGGQVLILMNPTGMEDLVAVTRDRQRMPQKSTFFFPKLLTGLVYYLHDRQG